MNAELLHAHRARPNLGELWKEMVIQSTKERLSHKAGEGKRCGVGVQSLNTVQIPFSHL